MMKRKIRVSKEPSASTSYLPVRDEARARFRHQSLLQDYQELLRVRSSSLTPFDNRETKEKSERLEKTLQRKLQLLAEVKFLRRKCQQFSAAPKTIHSKLEKQSQPQHPVFQKELSLKGRSQKGKHIPAQTSAALFDLNQISAPAAEEMEWFDQNAGMFKRFSMEGGDALANDVMPSICRDSGIGSSRSSKRKVSWHDPLALRV
ncbi:hypothetical protein KSP40_PGU016821 [Platanthera guangdongensis]|uniref:Uncharacterized protein n=1 Tax=Platanthera guangdongensis TaxID=2320717 RepID=A0ABR2LU40_9ASPA